MASIFRRGKQGIWCIKYYVNGRQAYYSLNTTDARIAKKMKRQIEGEEAKGELLAPSKTPLPVFLEDFCRFLATIRTPKSYSADISVLRVFFGPICPALQLGSRVNKRWRLPHSQRLQDTMKHVHMHAAFLEQITASVIEGFITRRISPTSAVLGKRKFFCGFRCLRSVLLAQYVGAVISDNYSYRSMTIRITGSV